MPTPDQPQKPHELDQTDLIDESGESRIGYLLVVGGLSTFVLMASGVIPSNDVVDAIADGLMWLGEGAAGVSN